MKFKFYNLNFISYISTQSRTIHHRHRIIQTLTTPFLNKHDRFLIPDSPNPNYCKTCIRWHFGHSHNTHDHQHTRSTEEGEKIFRLGLAADIGLTAGKALTGVLTGSTAIIADAAHSASDVVLSGVALWSYKVASAPKDKDHPYGHGKFETLGALGISCMLLATAGGIAWHAIDILLGILSAAPESLNHSMIHQHAHSIDMEHPTLALSMTVIAISIKECLYWKTKRAGEKGGSGLMMANAWHHRSDAISSVVALVGVGGSILGVKILDPLAGLLVSGMILKAGLKTGYQSVMELVDAAIPAQELDSIRETILQIEYVKGCHRLRGRRAGSSLYLDVHIEVDPFCSVSAAHEIGENVRMQIHGSHPEVSEIFIHIDPYISPNLAAEVDPGNNTEKKDFRRNPPLEHNLVDPMVFNILSSKFSKKMTIERITPHLLQGKTLLQVEVSMPSEMLIRDAMKAAEEAEKEVLKEVSNVIQVSIQLRLGRTISTVAPKFSRNLS